MKCKNCGTIMTDLTNGYGKSRNHICHWCKTHFWNGLWWTKKEWDDWLTEGENLTWKNILQ